MQWKFDILQESCSLNTLRTFNLSQCLLPTNKASDLSWVAILSGDNKTTLANRFGVATMHWMADFQRIPHKNITIQHKSLAGIIVTTKGKPHRIHIDMLFNNYSPVKNSSAWQMTNLTRKWNIHDYQSLFRTFLTDRFQNIKL